MNKIKSAITTDGDVLEELLGEDVFLRTVTHAWTGTLIRYDDAFMVLETAAWIADTGRFSNAMTDGTLSEIEPVPGPVWVSRGALVDMQLWLHDLPTVQK